MFGMSVSCASLFTVCFMCFQFDPNVHNETRFPFTVAQVYTQIVKRLVFFNI